jgi:hypothetical protein
MIIQTLSPTDPKWIEYARSFQAMTVFHHPNWMRALAETYQYQPCILVALDGKDYIQAAIPLLDVNSFLTGRQLLSLPFTDHCAPLSKSDQALRILLDHLASLKQEQTYKNIEIRWELPKHQQISPYIHYGLFVIDLPSDTQESFYNIQKRTRKYIKKAQRSDLSVKMGQSPELMQQFYKLQVLTRKKHGVPVQPRRLFTKIGEKLIQQDLGYILLAYQNNTCVAGKIVLYWQDTLTLKYGAFDEAYQSDYPNYLLTWKAIQWAVENKYKKIDMGRCETSNTGLRRYKLKWGAKEIPLTYSTYANIPSRVSENKLMHIMKTVIQHSPNLVCRLAGEILYKHFA